MSALENEFVLVYVTAPDVAVAEMLARTSVEKRLAACANILPGMHSIYHWKGQIEEAQECVILFKTRRVLFGDLSTHIASHHPYETPCIVALEISAGSAPFLQWIADETRPAID